MLKLIVSGYRILARRWRCPAGEIDLIATRNNLLIFVEVKYRHQAAQWHGISPRQQARICKAAEAFAATQNLSTKCECRFDVILLQSKPKAWWHWCQHFKNAWHAQP